MRSQTRVGESTDPDAHDRAPSNGLQRTDFLPVQKLLYGSQISSPTNQCAVAVVNVIGCRDFPGRDKRLAAEWIPLEEFMCTWVHQVALFHVENFTKRQH